MVSHVDALYRNDPLAALLRIAAAVQGLDRNLGTIAVAEIALASGPRLKEGRNQVHDDLYVGASLLYSLRAWICRLSGWRE